MGTLIGKEAKRIDAYDKVTGKGLYASDMDKMFPDAGCIRALRSPYAHAIIKMLDVSKAKKIDGVYYVLTGEEKGIDWDQFPKTAVIATDRVIWAGQTVALVAAENERIAEEAVNAIDVEYEVLPHVLNYQQAILPHPVSIVDPEYETRDQGFQERPADRATNRVSPNIVGAFFLNSGDVDEQMKKADIIEEGEFWTGTKTASPLETGNAICRYDNDGGITLWSNGMGVHGVIKATVHRVLGVPLSKIRVIQPYAGGSFGSRLSCYVEILTVLMTLRARHTLRFSFTRKDQFVAGPSNWPCETKVKLAATKDGIILANDYYLCEEIGAALNNTFFSGRLSSSGALELYRWSGRKGDEPNLRMDTYACATNTVPAAEYRGLGCPEAEFGIECLVNKLADDLHMSPVDIRLKNIMDAGERDAHGELITSIGVKGCLKAVADAINPDEEPVQDMPGWKKGRGVAVSKREIGDCWRRSSHDIPALQLSCERLLNSSP